MIINIYKVAIELSQEVYAQSRMGLWSVAEPGIISWCWIYLLYIFILNEVNKLVGENLKN